MSGTTGTSPPPTVSLLPAERHYARTVRRREEARRTSRRMRMQQPRRRTSSTCTYRSMPRRRGAGAGAGCARCRRMRRLIALGRPARHGTGNRPSDEEPAHGATACPPSDTCRSRVGAAVDIAGWSPPGAPSASAPKRGHGGGGGGGGAPSSWTMSRFRTMSSSFAPSDASQWLATVGPCARPMSWLGRWSATTGAVGVAVITAAVTGTEAFSGAAADGMGRGMGTATRGLPSCSLGSWASPARGRHLPRTPARTASTRDRARRRTPAGDARGLGERCGRRVPHRGRRHGRAAGWLSINAHDLDWATSVSSTRPSWAQLWHPRRRARHR